MYIYIYIYVHNKKKTRAAWKALVNWDHHPKLQDRNDQEWEIEHIWTHVVDETG